MYAEGDNNFLNRGSGMTLFLFRRANLLAQGIRPTALLHDVMFFLMASQ